jgi:DICT domain-containing protein
MALLYGVDPHFSVYELLDWQNVSNIFIEKRPMLAFYCRQIETEIVERGLQAEVYSGFQRLARVKPVLPRYTRMAQNGAAVSVFGLPGKNDGDLTAVRTVHLRENDTLVKEWFLVAKHPELSRALIAREVSGAELPHAERTFEGVVTSDAQEINRIARTIAATLQPV